MKIAAVKVSPPILPNPMGQALFPQPSFASHEGETLYVVHTATQ